MESTQPENCYHIPWRFSSKLHKFTVPYIYLVCRPRFKPMKTYLEIFHEVLADNAPVDVLYLDVRRSHILIKINVL